MVESANIARLRERLADILRRFVLAEDYGKSDLHFVRSVMRRFLNSRETYLVDPAE